MIKKILFIFVSIITVSQLFSEDIEYSDQSIINKNFSRLLFYDDDIYFRRFSFYDGTTVKGKEINKLLLEYPQNKKLVKKYNLWKISGYTFLGILGYSVCSAIYLNNNNIQDETLSEMNSVLFYTGGLCSIASFQLANHNLHKSVSNYNMYILGIPMN